MLVGTTSIENSELLSQYLAKEKLPHEVLNAKQHAREAEIVAQAGRPKAITIATNMAGRGTDIVLGGMLEPLILKIRDDESLLPDREGRARSTSCAPTGRCATTRWSKAGGLHIIGTERHESRRIDNQLRGRAGRQGDPGSSRFYLSLEDPLLRIFGGERLGVIMQKLKMPEGEPIEHPIVNRSIAKAQNRVESRNFDIRKQLLEYDDVANDQRRVIYQQRNELLESDDVADTIRNMIRGQIEDTVKRHVPAGVGRGAVGRAGPRDRRWRPSTSSQAPVADWMKNDSELTDETLRERVGERARTALWPSARAQVRRRAHAPVRAQPHAADRSTITGATTWPSLDHLRQGIHLRGYAQKNPKQEYKREAFELFSDMLDRIKQDVVKLVLTVQVRTEQDVQAVEEPEAVSNVQVPARGLRRGAGGRGRRRRRGRSRRRRRSRAPARRSAATIRAPAAAGKKYKHCHGKF